VNADGGGRRGPSALTLAMITLWLLVGGCGGEQDKASKTHNGTGQNPLTNDRANDDLLPLAFPALSPDGKKIAFASDRDGDFEIYAVSLDRLDDGQKLINLTDNDRADELFPAFSPDGKKIAFASDRDGNFEIYVMNSDGSNQTRLTSSKRSEIYPCYSPDGK
jgi:Tol biopolymer transport system component